MRRLSKVCDSRRQPIARLLLAIAVFAILLASCASFKHLTLVSNTFPGAKDCGKCHVEIYHEWSESDHAHAYTNPHFRAATDDYRFESCLSCHAPEPTTDGSTLPPFGRPAVRKGSPASPVTSIRVLLRVRWSRPAKFIRIRSASGRKSTTAAAFAAGAMKAP